MRTLIFILLYSIITLFVNVSCSSACIKGEGEIITKTIELDAIRSIALESSVDVVLNQGEKQDITVEGQKNLIDLLETDVKNGLWSIDFKECIKSHKLFTIYITMPTLEKAMLYGSGNITSKTKFKNLKNLTIKLHGSGDMKLDLETEKINTSLLGSGDMELNGTTHELSVDLVGSGDISANDLKSNDCTVALTGSGDVSVNVAHSIDASITGSGDIDYWGNPTKKKLRVTGSGDISGR